MNIQIRQLREAKHLTQKELAEKVGATVRQIGYWEKGNIALDDAAKIADVLECSLDELAGREWPRGNASALTADESSLVGSYRLMDAEQQARYKDLAGTFVIASEKEPPAMDSESHQRRSA